MGQAPSPRLEPVTERPTAAPLERRPPRYPAGPARAGGEGLVLVSFVVQADGTTREPFVLESLGSREFESVAVAAVETWLYHPAVKDGHAFEVSNNRVIIPFRMSRPRNGEEKLGAKPGFIKRYKRIHSLVSERQYDEALAAIDPMLRTQSINLYENARLNLLKASIFEIQGRDEDLYDVLMRMTLLRGSFIEDHFYQSALAKMAKLSLKWHRYGRAASKLRTLSKELGDELPADLNRLADEIERIKQDTSPYIVEAVLSADPYYAKDQRAGAEATALWYYTPLRSMISIVGPVEGRLDRYSIRCRSYVQDGDVELGREIVLDPDYGSCTVFVFGQIGTTFGLMEGAKLSAEVPSEGSGAGG